MREPYLHWKDEMPHVKTKNPVGIDFVVIKVIEPFVFNHIVMGACLPSEIIRFLRQIKNSSRGKNFMALRSLLFFGRFLVKNGPKRAKNTIFWH